MRVPLYVRTSSGQEAELHQQIIDQISDQVALGLLKPGNRLDTIELLQRTFGISHATVARAYAALEGRGIIETARKKGSFIAEIGTDLLRQLRIEYGKRQLTPAAQRLFVANLPPRDILSALKLVLADAQFGDQGAKPATKVVLSSAKRNGSTHRVTRRR